MSAAYFAFWLPVWAVAAIIGWRSPTLWAAVGRSCALALGAAVIYCLAGAP